MSLDPQTFTQGGLLDDVDVTFVSCRYVEWDYNGGIENPVLALHCALEYDDNGKLASADQYFSAGDLSRFQPSEDGTHAVAVGSAKGMADSTNMAILVKSIIDNGFPVGKFGDGDVSAIDGLFAHVNRIPQPKRGGNISEKNSAGYDKTVMIVTKIHKMPWEDAPAATRPAPGRPASRPTAAPTRQPAATAGRPAAPSAAESPSDDLTVAAATVLVDVLNAKNGTVAKGGIASGAFKALSKDPANRSAILGMITNDDWLFENGEAFGWSFDGKTVTAEA